jgi:hypothetical protein
MIRPFRGIAAVCCLAVLTTGAPTALALAAPAQAVAEPSAAYFGQY